MASNLLHVIVKSVQTVYVGIYPESGATCQVPGEIRELVNHFEAIGQVLPLDRFPQLAEVVW